MVLNLICYHKNLYGIYLVEWVNQFRESILNQTYKDFIIMEMNYGGGTERIFEDSVFESKDLPTFVHAMNYLIKKCLDNGADVVGNLNCDDIYNKDRLKIQMQYMEIGFDICSSNFSLMRDGFVFHKHKFDDKNIKEELNKNHNVVCHPVLLYSAKFLKNNKYAPEEVPFEDLLLWKRTIDNYRFIIAPENLVNQRIHDNSVCKSNNR